MQDQKIIDRFFLLGFLSLAIVYAFGMSLDLIDVDAAQYAKISKQMFLSGSYLEVYCREADYLDKPPLMFWSAAACFHIFGVHDWVFRLPSVLVLVLGIYSTYRLTKIYYTENTAKLAAFISASCFATYLMMHDVRADTMLTGWVLFSVWQIAAYNESNKLKFLIGSAIGIAMAMMTKGPIGLVIPVIAMASEFIYKRDWRKFFKWQYLIAILVIAVLLIPMCWGLYHQYDLHPEKETYGLKGPSGLRFFFWTQSFGRITGENYWDNNPDPFFLVHSFLWSFSPWIFFFIPAIYVEVKEKIKSKTKTEALVVGGFIITFIFLSLSHYQLPHYTFALHPFAAIITAKYCIRLLDSEQGHKAISILRKIQYGFHVLLIGILATLLVIFDATWISYGVFILGLAVAIFFELSKKLSAMQHVFVSTLILFVTCGLILNIHFYPKLLTYESGPQVAHVLHKQTEKKDGLLIAQTNYDFSLDFYSDDTIIYCGFEEMLFQQMELKNYYILADSTMYRSLLEKQKGIRKVATFETTSVTGLKLEFLNPATRKKAVKPLYLLAY
jgi:4-amino-4-deoxy-L-arabinose transferase-like glycosyltransferase